MYVHIYMCSFRYIHKDLQNDSDNIYPCHVWYILVLFVITIKLIQQLLKVENPSFKKLLYSMC